MYCVYGFGAHNARISLVVIAMKLQKYSENELRKYKVGVRNCKVVKKGVYGRISQGIKWKWSLVWSWGVEWGVE